MDDVRSSNTSLISMKNCSNINQSAKHNESLMVRLVYFYLQGDVRKISLTETIGEENGKSIDLNFELTPIDLPPKDPLSTNQCPEISSASLSEASHMLLNQQDSSGEEIEFSYSRAEGSSLVVMAYTRCLMYVMACEINPKCVNYKTFDHLLDLFRDLPQSP
ncbi:hypothetical protein Golax_000139 [Gossypium laxum]|uniref:Uncharacterized protein n=1 Tax=Gossypium laxum TaxID=34288 RepID=A0A7J9AT22_9ROSI|nr:hypothetical protein [Gossypium laxum]